MRTTIARCAITALAAIIIPGAGQAQLLSNGSFEAPGFSGPGIVYGPFFQGVTGWTLSGSGGVTIHKTPDLGNLVNQTFNFAQDGSYYLDLSGAGTHATIYQDFATVPSSLYQLSFYIGASSDHPPAATINARLDGTASLLNVTLTPNAPTANINWSHQTFLFLADSLTTRLSLLDVGPSGNGSFTDNNTSFVDNVTVTAVPEPASYGVVAGAAMLGLACLARRRANLPTAAR
jgi:Protein of unknown function (DUF642)